MTNPRSFNSWLPILLSGIAIAVSAYAVWGPAKTLPPGSSTASTLSTVLRTKRVRAAVVPYPPLVTIDPTNNEVGGYLVDVMNEIAGEAGFTVDYEPSTWANMVTSLQSSKVDVVVAGAFRTIPRAAQADFTEPLIFWGLSALNKSDDTRIQSHEDLTRAGLRVAVIAGTGQHEFLKKNLPKAIAVVTTGSDTTRPILEVIAGRADVALVDAVTSVRFAREHPEVKDLFASNPLTVFGTAFMVRTGDDEWLRFLNTSFNVLELSGRLEALEKPYEKDANWIKRPKIFGEKALPAP